MNNATPAAMSRLILNDRIPIPRRHFPETYTTVMIPRSRSIVPFKARAIEPGGCLAVIKCLPHLRFNGRLHYT